MAIKKEPKVAPGINYQKKWENATKEDKKKGNVTKVTTLIFDEYDPINREFYQKKEQ